MLRRFLSSLKIPVISVLRDSQAYVQAAAEGLGISEMAPYRVRDDIVSWRPIMSWLDQWHARRLDAEIAEEFERLTVPDDEAAEEQSNRLY